MSAGTLTATRLSKSYDKQVILDNVSLVVGAESRTGVVGPNGIGKTTLLKILCGIARPDSGGVRRDPPDLSVGYLAQELHPRRDETLYGFLARRTGVGDAEAKVDRLAQQLGSPSEDLDAYSDALARFVALGGGDFRARAEAVCDEVGLPRDRMDIPLEALSAGQRSRVQLAAILLSRFDVLCLDEPTNNLDFEGIERLERFVADASCGVVVVSHDRAFLDRAVTRIVEITEPHRRTTEFAGGWSEYVAARELARQQHEEAYGKFTQERGRLEDRMRQQRAWADKGVQKIKRKPPDIPKIARNARINRTEKQASKVRATRKMIDRLEKVDKPWEPWQLNLTIASARRSGHVVARLHDAVVERGSFVLGPLSLEVQWGERIAILGPNGSGKSTLIQALLGRLPLASGEQYLGPSVVTGEMDQERDLFSAGGSLIRTFCDATGMEQAAARTLLAKFRLPGDSVLRDAASLSPGERTRAVLASFMARQVNCLILDEPTNHLDLEAIEELESALDAYDGTLLVVTHDRWLLDNVRLTRTVELPA